MYGILRDPCVTTFNISVGNALTFWRRPEMRSRASYDIVGGKVKLTVRTLANISFKEGAYRQVKTMIYH